MKRKDRHEHRFRGPIPQAGTDHALHN
jgi:hypothetical protein